MTAQLKHRACITCCKTKCTDINDRRSTDGRILYLNKTVDNLVNCTQSLCNFKQANNDTDEYVLLYDKDTNIWTPTKTTDLYVNIYKNPRYYLTYFDRSSSNPSIGNPITALFNNINDTYSLLNPIIKNVSQQEFTTPESVNFELLNNIRWRGEESINVSIIVNIGIQRQRRNGLSLSLLPVKNGVEIPNIGTTAEPGRNITVTYNLSFITSLNPGDTLEFILKRVSTGGNTGNNVNRSSCFIRSLDIKVFALISDKLPITVINPAP